MYSLLIIEDAFDVKENVKECFSSNGNDEYKLDFSDSFIEGMNKIRTKDFDLVVIDVKLAKQAGADFGKMFREYCSSPVIFLLDINDEDEVKYVYSLSAASLVVRPFTASDIFESVVDYFDDSENKTVTLNLECCGIVMNAVTGLVLIDGTPVDIGKKATALLRILLENKTELVSRDVLIKTVWGEDYHGSDRVLDNQIRTLRKQLGSKGDLIRTIKGKGYSIGGK